ncbi:MULTISPECIES: hypothetical protein [Azorhizobium]|nr:MULTISPECIES: hypothetical protein [Azorhizobium]TDT90406.1 hypothetical protein DFO45_4262 [Azorhizobium sp. AG788]
MAKQKNVSTHKQHGAGGAMEGFLYILFFGALTLLFVSQYLLRH